MRRTFLQRVVSTTLRAGTHATPGARTRLKRGLRGTLTILVYHRIADPEEAPWLEAGGVPRTSPRGFEDQLEEMKALGGEFYTVDEVARGRRPPADRPGFVVTFDDGFEDNFSRALPALERLGIPGTFFVTTDLPGRRSLLWEHRLCWAARTASGVGRLRERIGLERTPGGRSDVLRTVRSLLRPDVVEELLGTVEASDPPGVSPNELYASWEQVVAAAGSGHQVAGHTASHRMRHVLDRLELQGELRRSHRDLVERLSAPVRAMSYPFNSYFVGEEGLYAEEGFDQLLTVDGGRVLESTPPDRLPRRTVFGIHDSMPRFRELMAQESPWS